MKRGRVIWDEILEKVTLDSTLFDRKVAAWITGFSLMGGKVWCAKGCSTCCSLAVNCTFPEALRSAGQIDGAAELRLETHVSMLRELSGAAPDFAAFLRMHRTEAAPCPFLNAWGECGIYAVRPVSCRSLLSTKESHWCGVDFGSLDGDSKRAYIESLDRSVNDFPLHYVALTRETGQELESEFCRSMAEDLSFALYGNLPVLVFLELRHSLSRHATEGLPAVQHLLAREGLDSPYLVTITA